MTPPAAAFKRIIVVLGTHRSGTSVLAQILSRLGVELGDDLVGPNEFNEDGHWENPEIVRLQERLLKSLRRQWYWQGGSVPLPAGWLEREETRRCQEALIELLASQRPQEGRPWGFKDPRTVRLLPLWHRVFSRLDLSPSYVLALRHPTEVASSLFRRDQMPRYAGAMLWLTSMYEAARWAPNAPIVDYDAWFEDAEATGERLARRLHLPADAATVKTAVACVQPRLRHVRRNRSSDASRSLPLAFAEEVFESLHGVTSLAMAPATFRHRITEYGYYAEFFAHWVKRYEERISTDRKRASAGPSATIAHTSRNGSTRRTLQPADRGAISGARRDHVRHGRIAGWAVDRRRPDDHCTMQLVEGTRVLADAVADEPIADELEGPDGHGFSFELPPECFTGGTHRLEVVAADTGEAIGAPIEIRHHTESERVLGAVQRPEINLMIEGWAYDPATPDERFTMSIFIDQQYVAEAAARDDRDDLRRMGYSDGGLGFRWEIPQQYLDGEKHLIHVLINERGLFARNSGIAFWRDTLVQGLLSRIGRRLDGVTDIID